MSRRDEEQAAGRTAIHNAPPHHPHETAYVGESHFERYVIAQLQQLRTDHARDHATLREDLSYINHSLNHLEKTMTTATRELLAAVKAADTKLEGYVAIINAAATVIHDAATRLNALKDEPTTDEINAVKDDLALHLTAMDASLDHMANADKPAAPAPNEPAPVPSPVPAPIVTS